MRQQHYIEQILKRFELENARNVQTPMSPGLQLKSTTELAEEEKTIMKDVPYMSMVGALRYAADCMRPDIAFATSQLARHLQSPGPRHLHAVKHCFQYLKTTRDYWLVLGGEAKEEETEFVRSICVSLASFNCPVSRMYSRLSYVHFEDCFSWHCG